MLSREIIEKIFKTALVSGDFAEIFFGSFFPSTGKKLNFHLQRQPTLRKFNGALIKVWQKMSKGFPKMQRIYNTVYSSCLGR